MAGNGAVTSGGGGGGAGASTTTINAASTAIASADTTRFQPLPPHHRRNRWTGCLPGLSCFGSQKGGGKRIVPAARTPNPPNNSQSHPPNQNPTLNNLSLLAPPSSPASFTNSALPSTAQSPSCFLSVNSPCTPSNMMFATGPYAHETQLVSPPVFSTFTTEPSTAPLTPPPELAQLTTPSSPDVPFARFLSSSLNLKENYNFPLYIPGSPSSSLISPASVTPRTGVCSPLPEPQPIKVHRSALSSTCGSPYARNFISAPESPFFHPATSAQFYLDQGQQGRGRPSLSRENLKQDVEEVEAYRASFGFSADEIITMQNYVGVSEAADESFTMCPLGNDAKACNDDVATRIEERVEKMQSEIIGGDREGRNLVTGVLQSKAVAAFSNSSLPDVHPFVKHKEETLQQNQELGSKRGRPGQSCSDAEIEYRRGRSLRESNGIAAWRNSMP